MKRAGLAVFAAMASVSVLAVRAPGIAAAGPPAKRAAPVLLASDSPFAGGCYGAQSGANYRNSVVEPSLAADPGNPAHLVAAWQQDRWSNEAVALWLPRPSTMGAPGRNRPRSSRYAREERFSALPIPGSRSAQAARPTRLASGMTTPTSTGPCWSRRLPSVASRGTRP